VTRFGPTLSPELIQKQMLEQQQQFYEQLGARQQEEEDFQEEAAEELNREAEQDAAERLEREKEELAREIRESRERRRAKANAEAKERERRADAEAEERERRADAESEERATKRSNARRRANMEAREREEFEANWRQRFQERAKQRSEAKQEAKTEQEPTTELNIADFDLSATRSFARDENAFDVLAIERPPLNGTEQQQENWSKKLRTNYKFKSKAYHSDRNPGRDKKDMVRLSEAYHLLQNIFNPRGDVQQKEIDQAREYAAQTKKSRREKAGVRDEEMKLAEKLFRGKGKRPRRKGRYVLNKLLQAKKRSRESGR